MYVWKLTNEETNERIYVSLPTINIAEYNTRFPPDAAPWDIDYIVDNLGNGVYDTEKYTLFCHANVNLPSDNWDLPTIMLEQRIGFNQLIANEITLPFSDMVFNITQTIMQNGIWVTENGKRLKVYADGRAVLTMPDGRDISFNEYSTWLQFRSPYDATLYHIVDIDAFFRTNEENMERGESSGYGLIDIYRVPNDTENKLRFSPVLAFQPSEGFNKAAMLFWTMFRDEPYVENGDDLIPNPYEIPPSQGGVGGGGSWMDRDDTINVPPLPQFNASGTGMVTIFNPTMAQINNLARYLWSGDIEDIISKMWADPMDVMMGLHVVGCPVSASNTKTVSVAGRSTGVSMNVADEQYIEVDCGTETIEEYYGSYLDYAPYTKISITLPFIGEKELDTNILMGKSVNVKYHCDILTGACVAYIVVGGKVKYQFNGNISTLVPFTSSNYSRMISSAFGLVSDIVNMTSGVGGAVSGAAGAITDITNMKPDIHKSGNLGSTTGLLSVRIPYLLIERPNLCIPEDQNKYEGYPTFVTVTLGSMRGYTRISDIIASTFTCTKEEQEAIISKLKQGVII